MTPFSRAAVPSDGRYQPGDLIHDKYLLVRPLGQGGMGTVWVAQNTVLQVSVAVKLIALGDQHDDADETAERLLREARAAARLDHPAIVRVFDFGRTDHGDPFIVMELLHGESLADTLARDSRMTGVQAVRAMLPIADALASAHDKGVVHRDVKPENVILSATEDGRSQPKLLDFGIASLQEKSTKITQEKRLTREGSVVGTPAYMSPEQAMGKADLDQRTDVWSFGVMLYELTTGRLPFDADNYNALLYEIINRVPEPVTTHAAGDDELWQIIEVALRKRPEERWGSMHAFGEALALWLVDRGVNDDICAASLRSTWLDSSSPGINPADLGETTPVSQPQSDKRQAPLPLPTKPPARKPSSKLRRKFGWPARLGFLAACFIAGVVLVGQVLGGEASEEQAVEAARGASLLAAEGRASSSDAALGEHPLAQRSDAAGKLNAVPLDDVLGEVEGDRKSRGASHSATLTDTARKKQRARATTSSSTPPKKKPRSKDQVDFGF
jgi:serine/threonine-protein kinase